MSLQGVNHADIPSWLRQQGAIGQGMYDKLVAFGHNPATLQQVIRDTGVTVGQKLQQSTGLGRPAPAAPSRPAIDYSQPWDLSYDGKSRDYRDPNKNFNTHTTASRSKSGGDYDKNSHAVDYLNPLYGYGSGRVNDAARALGIKNINSQREVDQILAQIRGGYGAGGGGGGGASTNTNRSSGEYGDIQGAQAADRQAGQDAAANFAGMNPALGGIDPAIQAQLDALTLANNNLTSSLEERETYWANSLEQLQTSSNNALQQMESMMLQQQLSAQNTQNLLQTQLASTQSALENQQRMSANLANAYVPAAEQSALTAAYGDQRTTTRKKDSNSLNDLSIVTGVGAGTSLSGLTLA